jgi:hypothetical protein
MGRKKPRIRKPQKTALERAIRLQQVSAPVIRAVSPFARMSEEHIPGLASAMGSQFAAEYDEALAVLREYILSLSPIGLLSMLASHGLTSLEGLNREYSEADPILQHHVELVQALCLT